jgi:SAM-dependent methyltransferase
MWVDVFKDRNSTEGASTSGIQGGKTDGAKQRGQASGRITKVYGVEPNKDVHAELHRRVAAAGLDGTYEVVPVGIESLGDASRWNGRIEKGSVDCIISILCLCSIPDPERNIRELYSYLKKGGRWYVYEHVRASPRYPAMRLYQCKCPRCFSAGGLVSSHASLHRAPFSPSRFLVQPNPVILLPLSSFFADRGSQTGKRATACEHERRS